ncbi:MAG: serine hydrolase domain-containing protein, partial [Dokdonella sp.]
MSLAKSQETAEVMQAALPEFPQLPADASQSSDASAEASLSAGRDDASAAAGLSAYVDGVVSSFQREHGLAALTVAVVKDDDLLLGRAYGFSDIEGARRAEAETSLFRIGSVSKTFTWTAVMMLVERGLLDLDADLNGYLKQVKVNEAFGQPVTMRQLMHHRAGFEDSLRLFAVADDDTRSLAELLAEHLPKRVYPPGMRTSYSNWGAGLAAQVVEDVAGEPYGVFLQREILDPLGMRDTTWTPP